MDPAVIEIALILVLIVANGVFAMSEIAVVSAKPVRLEERAESGDAGAAAALELMKAPSRFFSTVQLGITLVGILAGAIGGATLANRFAAWLDTYVPLGGLGSAIGIGAVVVVITYASVVIGELVPKRIGLGYAEEVASRFAAPMEALSRLVKPAVAVLSFSTDAILRVMRVRRLSEPSVSQEEIRRMLERASISGGVEPAERDLVERVFRFGDRAVTDVMTPYPDLVWLDLSEAQQDAVRLLSTSNHSHFPVIREKRDQVVGIVHARDLAAQSLRGQPFDLAAVVQPALFVPETTPAADVLDRFREASTRVALVIDEYGSLQGMITANDVLQALVGELPEIGEDVEPEVLQREDGSWLVDGGLPVDELKATCGIPSLPGEDERSYRTVGGLVMTYLGRVPAAGDHFEWEGFRFEVVDMDRRRIDKVLVEPPARAEPATD